MRGCGGMKLHSVGLRLSHVAWVGIVVVVAVAQPSAARADQGAPPAAGTNAVDNNDARRHFEEGTKLFNLGEFAGAIVEYKAAYKSRPDPVFLYNIAQAYRQSGDLQQAVFFYRSYLRNSPTAENRGEVEERVRKLEAQLDAQKAAASAPPNTAVAPKPGLTTTTPDLTTPPPAEPAATTATPASNELVATAPPKHDSVAKKWWLWTAVGVGVVAIGVGLGVGLTVGASHHTSAPSSQYGTTPVF